MALWTFSKPKAPSWNDEEIFSSSSASVGLNLYPLRSQIFDATSPSWQILQYHLYPGTVFHLKQQRPFFFFFFFCPLLFLCLVFLLFVFELIKALLFLFFFFWFWNLECDKLFLHGCYNNKLFFLQIHAWSDQYFFWWRLWQSGSFFHFQSFLNFISLILMIFIFWIIIFGLWYSLKFALSLKHYRKMIPNFAIDECFFFLLSNTQ